jgi:MFS family permease
MASRDLRRLALAYVVFVVADLSTYIAILVYAYERGGTGAVALVAAIQLAPSALIAPLAATAGDRHGPAVLLRRRYLALGLSCAAGAAALLANGPPAVAYVAAALISVIVAATRPLHRSLLPEVADGPEDLTAANAVLSSAEGIGSLVAPLLAGLVLALMSVGAVFAIAAALLVPAGLGLATLHHHHRPALTRSPASARSELRDGLRVLRQGPGARAAFGSIVVINVAMGAARVLVVPLAVDTLAVGDAAVGWLSAGLGAGLVLGGVAAGLLAGRARLSRWVAQGLVVWGAVLATVGYAPDLAVAVLVLMVAATAAAVADLATRTLLQRLVPGPLLTRALGLAEAAFIGSTFVGSVIAAPLDSWFTVPQAFAIVGAATVVAALVSGWVLSRAEQGTAAPERQLGLLRLVPITQALDPATMEGLALRLERVGVGAGQRVITEGEVGDRFYIVERGVFGVRRGEGPLAELGPGDAFGEVALLLDEPRNATVEARTAGELWTLERADFIEALTGTPQAHGVARGIAAERR